MSPLAEAILELAEAAAPMGATMGRIVDELEGRGYGAEVVEHELWSLLGLRRLTPSGFVCRKVRRRDPMGEVGRVRTYEMLFLPWSDALDRQLELALPEGPEDSEEPEDSDP